VQRKPTSGVIHADGRVASREERVVGEDDVSILSPNDRFVTKKVVHVASYAFGRVLHEPPEPRRFGSAKHEHAALESGAEGQLAILKQLES
jgi:hypothetical protein